MRALLLELRPAFGVHQPRYRVWKLAERVNLRRIAAGFDEDRPAGAKAAQRIVQPGRRSDQFSWRRAVKVRSPEPRGALEAAVLVQDHAVGNERRPRKEV